jgi:hypothetical protein
MAQFESLLWERRPLRVPRIVVGREERGPIDEWCEFTAGPPGRLGRLLLAEIERYLDFFAVAHARDASASR